MELRMDTQEIDELLGNREPAASREAFHCPQSACGVYAKQRWGDIYTAAGVGGVHQLPGWSNALCEACGGVSVWLGDTLVYPAKKSGPKPAADMPAEVLAIYEEARDVSPYSKKSAAGLLRLALQMLVDDLEPGSSSINTKIGTLVKRGLDSQVQQAMDVLRVLGNEAVHPGTIDLDADDALLPALFGLVNLIVEQVVTRPKHVGGLFGLLPPSKLEQITKRDSD